jgi:hypothetical protein
MKFDTYTLQARVLPAVIFMLPFFIEANYIIAILGYQIAISATIANLILFVFLMLFANWARHFGRKKEKKLFAKWDGAPTTRFLRSDNTEYNTYKRVEIKKYLKMMFNNIKMPSVEEEQENRNECDKKYEAYISNLRTLTRDSKEFALLQSENRNYGMWRNLYGLKIISIVIVLIIFLANVLLAIFLPSVMSWVNCIILNAILAILALIWSCVVTQSKIKDVAECYARQLLDTVIILKDKNTKDKAK